MTRDEAKEQIHEATRDILSKLLQKAKSPVNHEPSYICPFCGHGKSGDGLAINKHSKGGFSLKCFGCDFSGDIIELYQKMNGADYNTALSLLAEGIGISIDTTQAAQNRPQTVSKVLPDKNTAATHESQQTTAEVFVDYTEYYQKCTARLEDASAISFLKARGITLETAKRYSLGYDPSWISPTVIQNQEAKGSSWRPQPVQKIIIPTSANAYIARAMQQDDSMRYANTGKPVLFNAKALYEGHRAVFITEGAFDALSIIQCGAAAVGLNSTSNIHALLRYLNEKSTESILLLALDNDTAGRKATEELQTGLDQLHIRYQVTSICGNGKDPNEALQRDKEAFTAAVRKAIESIPTPELPMSYDHKPHNTSQYIDNLLIADIGRMKAAGSRKTGFPVLDKLSNGLYAGLYVIAATSSLGKTTLALQVADNLAAAGHDILFFSLEQSRLELITKSFSRLLKQEKNESVSSLTLRTGADPDNLQAAAKLYKSKIGDHMNVIEGNFGCNIDYISAYVREYISKNGTSPIIFVDYLQILQPSPTLKSTNTREAVDQTVTALKRLSRDYGLTVFIISSVNRANYMQPIDFESLKESGGIEYTADVVWGLQLQCLDEEKFTKQNNLKEKRDRIKEAKAESPRQIKLVCLKNRYGISNFDCDFAYYPECDLYTQETEGFNKCYNDPFGNAAKIEKW